MTDPVQRLDFGRVSVFLGHKSGKYPDGNQVVVRGSDTRVAFDTPLVANRIGAELDAAELILLGHVHEDHMAGLHRLPRAAVQAHELDVDAVRSWDALRRHYGVRAAVADALLDKLRREFFYVPRPDASGYADGALWELGRTRVRALHMPGHTAGHCVLLVEPEGVAFLGDIDLTGFGPYYGDASSSLAAFRATLARVAELPAAIWVTSHHRGVYTDRGRFQEALAAFAAHLEQRNERLVRMLADGAKSLDELAAMRLVYPPQYEELWVDDAERRTIAQHLDELVAAGRVALDDAGRFVHT
ncbi:MAG: MBL fold metallo-hydrolase [Proteobacteria bacterium]|mgnify:FL=1|nr:MBL fold metallo-hydrolase [Pseudomonadota bacterium]HOL37333.1 MBL fold metallo-hydrolase [Rubrivivax sp.]